ncbi:hypothetical protein GCM10020369_58280 [Cryptosporangium minutisporangium]|uniref:Uncharacterized protein n=1 Tax=Cryptosporangium minutisporangium TaxID=113569 RepID=A0ABP6T4W1_9ACTN
MTRASRREVTRGVPGIDAMPWSGRPSRVDYNDPQIALASPGSRRPHRVAAPRINARSADKHELGGTQRPFNYSLSIGWPRGTGNHDQPNQTLY